MLLAAMLPTAAMADQVLTVDTIVVTGSRSTGDLLSQAASMSVVKPDLNVSADNVADLLKDIGSVNLSSDGTPGVKRVSIRGENASRTLILVDGERIDDYKNKSGAPLLVNPFFIDRIEVLKGPSSVLYGSDAMGGIVNVISKQASDRPFAAEGGIAYVGSGNGFSEFVNVSGTQGGFRYVLGGFNTDMGDLYLADRERVDNTSYYSKGVNAQLSYAFSDQAELTFKSEYFDLNAFTSTTVEDSIYSTFRAHIPEWERVKNSLKLDLYDLNEYVAKVSLSGYLQNNDKKFNSTMSANQLAVEVLNEQDTYGGNIQLEFSLGDLFYLTTGYDGRVDELNSDSYAAAPFLGYFLPGSQTSLSYSDDDYKQSSHALYALLETYLTERLTLDTGVRWNYVKTSPGSSSLDSMFAGMPGFDGSHDGFSNSHFVGSAGLVYRAFDNGAFRLNWSQGFRVPNIQELYLTTFTGEIQMGNSDLKPETSNNYEAGFRYEGDRLTGDVALFYTKAENYIETYRRSLPPHMSNMPLYSYHNIASAESYGLEASMSYDFDYLLPYLDLTLMQRRYDTGSQSSTDTGTPKLKGRAGFKYDDSYAGVPYYADFFMRFASACKNDNLDGVSYFDDSRFAGYVTFNLQAGLSLGQEHKLHLYVGVDNILDKDYQTTELIKEAGRFFSAGLSAEF